MNFGIHVTLPDNTTAALFQISRSPGCVKVMESDQPVLYIHTGSHLKGGTHEHTDLTGADFTEQFLFAGFGVRFVDESDLLSRNPSCHKFVPDVIIYGKSRFFGSIVFLCQMLQCSEFRAVEVCCRSFGNFL